MEKVHGSSRGESRPACCFRYLVISTLLVLFITAIYVPTKYDIHVREVPLPGWPANLTRDLNVYVCPDNDTILIAQPEICSPDHRGGADTSGFLTLLIVVCSSPSNFVARSAIRDTWGTIASTNGSSVRIAFLLGQPRNASLQERIEEESHNHGDIIQEGFVDSYNNLSVKSVMMLKWVSTYCPKVHYVMKTDDDLFVNVPNLLGILRKQVVGRFLLLGSLICGAKPIGDASNKWYSPRYMFEERVYPNYLSGTGYVMSRNVVPKLYAAALKTPLFHLEDVYVTGICSRRAGIQPQDHSGFSYQRLKIDPCAYRETITSHRVSAKDLHQVWKLIHQEPHPRCPNIRKEKSRRRKARSSCVW